MDPDSSLVFPSGPAFAFWQEAPLNFSLKSQTLASKSRLVQGGSKDELVARLVFPFVKTSTLLGIDLKQERALAKKEIIELAIDSRRVGNG